METKIERITEMDLNFEVQTTTTYYNPEAMDHRVQRRMKSIELTDEYTRIDFIYQASMIWDNGGWIRMEKDAYIQPVGSVSKYYLQKAINIPIAPIKHYFKKKGEYHSYTLIFPALPKDTKSIDIIEKLAPGTWFNFFNVDFSSWMTVPHACDAPRQNN